MIFITNVNMKLRCGEDTMQKTVDIRRNYEVGLRTCNNLLHPPKLWVVEDCCTLSYLTEPVFGPVSSLHFYTFA